MCGREHGKEGGRTRKGRKGEWTSKVREEREGVKEKKRKEEWRQGEKKEDVAEEREGRIEKKKNKWEWRERKIKGQERGRIEKGTAD